MSAKNTQGLFKRHRRPGDLIFSLLFLALCVFLIVNLEDQTTWSKGTKLPAQPAFWPYLSVGVMTFFALLHLVSGLLSPAVKGRWLEVAFWLRSFEYAAWFMVYVFVVPILGYLLSTILFTGLLSVRLGFRSTNHLLLAVIFGIAVVVLFKTFLQVKVPGGQIYEYLPTALRSFMLTYF